MKKLCDFNDFSFFEFFMVETNFLYHFMIAVFMTVLPIFHLDTPLICLGFGNLPGLTVLFSLTWNIA